MKARNPDLPALDALREELHTAAQREIASPAQRRRRRPHRRALIAALAALVVAGGATAAQLISSGSPVKDVAGKPSRYEPRSSRAAIPDATAPDPARKLPWGVLVYTSASGQPCAIAAQVRAGTEPGLVEKGVFHPNAPNTSGACGKRGLRHPFVDVRYITSAPARTIIYGRARPGKRLVEFRGPGGRDYSAHLGRRGGFLFVFAGRFELGPYRLLVK